MLSQSLRANQTSATYANTPYNHVRLEARNLALPPEPVLNDSFFAVSQVNSRALRTFLAATPAATTVQQL